MNVTELQYRGPYPDLSDSFRRYSFVACLLLIPFILSCGGSSDIHPTDAELEGLFNANRKEFEALIEMAQADPKVVRIDNDFIWLDDNASWPRPDSELGMSQARWDKYRDLFYRLKLSRGLLQYPKNGQIFLIASSEGLLTGGSSKGYLFSTDTPHTLRQSLDGDIRENFGKEPMYREISENWYLYFQNQ